MKKPKREFIIEYSPKISKLEIWKARHKFLEQKYNDAVLGLISEKYKSVWKASKDVTNTEDEQKSIYRALRKYFKP